MSNQRRGIWVGLWIAVFSFVLLLAVIPQKYIPERLTPFVSAKGRFDGKPIRFTTPKGRKSEVAATIRIRMEQGICQVSLRHGAELNGILGIGEGNSRNRIPTGSELVLDPQGNVGDYDITIGPEWHPLAPKARRFVFLPMAIAMMVAVVFTGKFRSLASRLGVKRGFFLAAMAVVSGFVFYPVFHEAGHMIFGMLCGAVPNWDGVVWTCLGGEEPHASFSDLPERAVPFMTAGGPIVPTLVALLLLLIWRFVYRRASWYVSAALVSIAILFLFSTLGCLFELYRNTHMDALSVHFGLTGPLRIAFSLSPLLVAVTVYVWLGMKFRESESRKQQSEDASMKTPTG
jgi:hypothetical protein